MFINSDSTATKYIQQATYSKITVWTWILSRRKYWVLRGGRRRMKKAVEISQASLLLLLLPLPRLVILKPIKHILPLNVTISPQPRRYLLYLLRTRSPHSLPIQILQHAYLLLGRIPPRRVLHPHPTCRSTALHVLILSLHWFLLFFVSRCLGGL